MPRQRRQRSSLWRGLLLSGLLALPLAAAADAHFRVAKHVRDGRTTTSMDRLDDQARVTELARMLGGQSDAARHHAEALLPARR